MAMIFDLFLDSFTGILAMKPESMYDFFSAIFNQLSTS